MGSDQQGTSSNPENNKMSIKEKANLIMSSLSFSIEKNEQVLSMVQSTLGRGINEADIIDLLNKNRDTESNLSQVLKSLHKTRSIFINLMEDVTTNANTTSVEPPLPTPSITPHNQPNATSVLQHNQAAAMPHNILVPHSQPRVFTYRGPFQSNSPMIHPQRNAAILRPSILQQYQAAAAAARIPQAQQQTCQPPSNVGGTPSKTFTRKRCLEALYDENNELPGKLKHLTPNLIERILAEIVDPDVIVKWDDIAGLEHAKNCVQETVLWPVLNPRIFQGISSIGKGILLFGPPGTGKTMIGKAIAGEMKATFFNISACSLMGMWLGECEMLVRALFALARQLQPSVIFLDEVDSLLKRRSSQTEHEAIRRLKTQVLVEMEGIDSGTEQIIVIGATNMPQDLDEAARRRLGKRLYIPLPCAEARLQIIRNAMEKAGKYVLSKEDLDVICKLTDGYSGSDMKNLVKEAVMGPIRDAIRDVKKGKAIGELEPEDLRPVVLQDFQNALKEVRPSVSQQELAAYVEWNAKFGSISH